MPEKDAVSEHHYHAAIMSAAGGLPLQFSPAAAAFHVGFHHPHAAPPPPLPVDQRTHEGRYIWGQLPSAATGIVQHQWNHPSATGYVFSKIYGGTCCRWMNHFKIIGILLKMIN